MFHWHKQNLCIRIPLFYADADSLNKVCLPDSDITIEKEWIKLRFSGIICNILGNSYWQPIAFAYTVILKVQRKIELMVKIRLAFFYWSVMVGIYKLIFLERETAEDSQA